MTDAERLVEAGWEFLGPNGGWRNKQRFPDWDEMPEDHAVSLQSAIDAAVTAEREACADLLREASQTCAHLCFMHLAKCEKETADELAARSVYMAEAEDLIRGRGA